MHKFMKYVGEPLIIIGALNWGLVGAFNFNLVSMLFGADSILSNIIYILVGIAGVCKIYDLTTYKDAKKENGYR